MSRNIGGSVLPSSDPQILQPIVCTFGTLQVRAMPELDTHMLFWSHDRYESMLAEHPNGYSCHNLAKRMVAGNKDKVRQQAQYLLDCGGMTRHIDCILNVMDHVQ